MYWSDGRGLTDKPRCLNREQARSHRELRSYLKPSCRSLNLSNTVAVAVYEAWRQLGFK